MTNVQLLLSIGIPSVLVVLSWIQSNQRLTDMNGKISDLKGDMNRQFTDVNRRVDQVNRTLEIIQTDMTRFYGITQKLEGRMDEIAKR